METDANQPSSILGTPPAGRSPSRMRITQLIASLEKKAAGPTYSVPRLCQALSERGNKVQLMSLGTPMDVARGDFRDTRYDWDLRGLPILGKLGKSYAMRAALAAAAPRTNIFHTHGLWRMPNVYPADAARRSNRPFVLSPRGMFGPDSLKFSAMSKKIFWVLAQRRAARLVTCFHATSEQEYQDIRANGLHQPVAVIPNGIDMPTLVADPGLVAHGQRPNVLFLGRLHPVKALDRLILAWKALEPDFPEWRLDITGPSEGGYVDELRALVQEHRLTAVDINGAAFGEEKQRALQGAEVFVLPSLNENFGIAVAESLAAGTPVIATRGTPWSGLEDHRCGWWIDHGVTPLVNALRDAMFRSIEARREMGRRGRDWMARDFTWERVATDMETVYRWIIDGGEVADCIRLS